MRPNPPNEVWIGLVGVKPILGHHGGPLKAGQNAYLSAVVVAANEVNYKNLVASALSVWNLAVFEFDNIQPVRLRGALTEIPEAMMSLVNEIAKDGRVRCSEIFPFPEERSDATG